MRSAGQNLGECQLHRSAFLDRSKLLQLIDQHKVTVLITALTKRLDTSGRERENGEAQTFGRTRWRGSRNVIADSCGR